MLENSPAVFSSVGGNMKSHEISCSLEVLAEIINDYANLCGVEQDSRDMKTIISRVKHEGRQFLTMTLPTYGDSFFQALEHGSIETIPFPGFRKRGGFPVFFRVFLSMVFDKSGVLLSKPDPAAIAAIRQIAYTFKKQEEKCNDIKTINALKRFKEVELELADIKVSEKDWDDYNRLCCIMWGNFMSQYNSWHSIPKHGPGATADRLKSNRKYLIGQWPYRSEGYFPLTSFALPSENAISSKLFKEIRMVNVSDEQPVRVIAVPKTAKTPRIIAIEPTCMQYMQQAISRDLMRELESYHLTKGHINFKSQQVNKDLAIRGSLDRLTSTIDLSEASDRVRNDLVEPMFAHNPDLYGAIQACRSLRADVAGDVLTLTKFASMGSALCFPVESMFFYTLSVLGVLRYRKALLDWKAIVSASQLVYTYGDDIIVPTSATQEVCDTLEAFGLRVNKTKSFSKSHFRESCGQDAFFGQDVTPVYIRRMFPTDGRDASSILSFVAASNQFYKKGLWLTATAIKKMVERLIGKLPVMGSNAEGVGWLSYTFSEPNTLNDDIILMKHYPKARWNKKYQRTEYHTLVAKTSLRRDRIDDYPALMKFFIEPSLETIGGREINRDLEQSSRYGTVTLKRRWTRPY